MMIDLTEAEIDALVYESGPDADHHALIDEVERIVADRERRAAMRALRDAANAADRFARETYPADIFKRPSSEDYVAINALLDRERGHQLDGVAADCMSRAIHVQAEELRARAADLEAER